MEIEICLTSCTVRRFPLKHFINRLQHEKAFSKRRIVRRLCYLSPKVFFQARYYIGGCLRGRDKWANFPRLKSVAVLQAGHMLLAAFALGALNPTEQETQGYAEHSRFPRWCFKRAAISLYVTMLQRCATIGATFHRVFARGSSADEAYA